MLELMIVMILTSSSKTLHDHLIPSNSSNSSNSAHLVDFVAMDINSTHQVPFGNQAKPIVIGNFLSFRFAPYFRAVMLFCFTSHIRQSLWNILRIVPAFLDVATLVALFLCFWAWMGMLVFKGSEEGVLSFGQFRDSVVSLLVLLTTVNYPDGLFFFFILSVLSYFLFHLYKKSKCSCSKNKYKIKSDYNFNGLNTLFIY